MQNFQKIVNINQLKVESHLFLILLYLKNYGFTKHKLGLEFLGRFFMYS